MNRPLTLAAICTSATLLITAAPTSAEAGDPTGSEQVVADSPTAVIKVTSNAKQRVELRLRYHSYYESGNWTPPDDADTPHVTFSDGDFTFTTPAASKPVALSRPSQDDEADDEPRVEDGTSPSDGKYILTGRFSTSVDPRKVSFGRSKAASLNYTGYTTIETDGPDYTYYEDQDSGSFPVVFMYGSKTSISAPKTVPKSGSLNVSGKITEFSPAKNKYVAIPSGTVELQHLVSDSWVTLATDELHGTNSYLFDNVKQAKSKTVHYRVYYQGDDTTASSPSSTVTVKPR